MQNLRTFFESEYPGKEAIFENLIKPIFVKAHDTTLTKNQELKESEEKQIKSFSVIAQVRGGFPITFADVELQDSVALKRSRVSIQNCVRRMMADNSNAIIFFHFTDSKKEWRVSFVNRQNSNKNSTNAKRYTYLCGIDQHCRTIAERFETLRGLSVIKDKELLGAFSVESVSDDFFKEYKVFYEDFVQYITGNRYVKSKGKTDKYEKKTICKENAEIFAQFKNLANGDYELACKYVRDYVKKFMGRLVFLQFLQKKGWLGGNKNEKWGNGDRKFLLNLFEKSNHQDDFLDAVFEPLFFGMLNTVENERNELFAKNKWDKNLLELFGKVPYLNGGLFEADDLDKIKIRFPKEMFSNPEKSEVERKFNDKADYANKPYPFTESCGLLDFFARYNFTIDETDPSDMEIGIDPEMLGKIFENQLEDNKDKGAFYTPKEIVQYMCRESLIAYLGADASSRQKIRTFVETHDASYFTETEKSALLAALKEVKICDPAVGSGAFPMGMLNELYACRMALQENGKTAAEIKKYIVKENIYGVDIEKGAVDIARLRFWLAIIVDEEKPLPLPNLDYKIMQGNSLLESYKGIDLSKITEKGENELFDDADDVKTLVTSLGTYFDTNNHADKEAHREAIKSAVLDLLEKRGYSTEGNLRNELSKLDLHENSEFFLWHTWFYDVFNRPQKEGFDVVIGNPPYIQIKWLSEKDIYKKSHFKTFESTGDIYCLFYEKGIELLAQGGHLCFITSNKWMITNYGEKLRNYLIDNVYPKKLINLGPDVFESATVDTNILVCQKGQYKSVTKVADLEDDKLNELRFSETKFTKSMIWKTNSLKLGSIKQKLDKILTRLPDFDVELDYGILTGANKTFILSREKAEELIALDKKNKEIIKPILRGKDLERYGAKFNNVYLLCTHNGIKSKNIPPINIKKDYPSLIPYFESFGEDFKKRGEQGDNYWNLRNCAYINRFEETKIIYADIVQDTGKFYLDKEKYYTNDTAFLIFGKNLNYLLAILNSKAFSFFYKNFYCGGSLGDKGLRFKRDFLLKVPIPTATPAQQQEIITLVDQILTAKKDCRVKHDNDSKGNPDNDKTHASRDSVGISNPCDTSALEAEIDKKVYALYGLTEEEIKVVEGK